MTATLPPKATDAEPLFIVGSMRSGSTWMRNLLRRVPNFICPEETHFMRWADPYRSPGGMRPHRRNKLLEAHRAMDGVDPEVFGRILATAPSRANLHRYYVSAYADAQGVTPPFRWFDKSPQNIYGLPLILADFPRARILHLVRNPLNVVASLKAGRQVHIPDLLGAINCWAEAVAIWDTMAPLAPERMIEIRYEDVLDDVPGVLAHIARFAKLDAPEGLWQASDARPEQDLWKQDLSEKAAHRVARRCGVAAARRGYDLAAQVGL